MYHFSVTGRQSAWEAEVLPRMHCGVRAGDNGRCTMRDEFLPHGAYNPNPRHIHILGPLAPNGILGGDKDPLSGWDQFLRLEAYNPDPRYIQVLGRCKCT